MERQFVLHTPLMWLTKAQTVRRPKSWELWKPYLSAIVATMVLSHHVGPVQACHLRQKGFSEAGIIDPLIKRAEEVT